MDSSLDSLRSSCNPIDARGYPIFPQCLESFGLRTWINTLRLLGQRYVNNFWGLEMHDVMWSENLATAKGYLYRHAALFNLPQYEIMRYDILLTKYFESVRHYWIQQRNHFRPETTRDEPNCPARMA